ncbi:heterogeneous nuclear ribonucleoprotein 1-like isoform X2 [Asparagus officinalis]|uniref:heterogeneous nuclear ribonucleoprotein 1-like isoform X2 n=1 Tax=Asparagus officinalis TaxID=4686 RepID=UPI00098E7AAD|nr:heterogeneous nuclear ribonucleoprotein 1-like isoform X2 [Asparagus officinalis]
MWHILIFSRYSVHVLRALSPEEWRASALSRNPCSGRLDGGGGEGGNDTKKIFVGGLSSTLTEDKFLQHFRQYGVVTHTDIRRGFGFVSYSNEDAVERALRETTHEIDGKRMQVERFNPDHGNLNSDSGGRSKGTGYYDHRCGPDANSVSYDGIMDASTYVMQPQTAGGGYPSYGNPRSPYGRHSLGMGYYDPYRGGCGADAGPYDGRIDANWYAMQPQTAGGGYPSYGMPRSSLGVHSGGTGYFDPYLSGSGAYCGSYDGRMDTNRYDMQPQTTGGGYPSYGSSGHGMPSSQDGFGGYARPSGAQGNPSARTGGDAGYGSASLCNTQPLATTSAGSYDGRIETNRHHVPPQTAGVIGCIMLPKASIGGRLISTPGNDVFIPASAFHDVTGYLNRILSDRQGGAPDSNQAGDANESSGNSRA